ncbi:putative bifunctional diguanylate cyclase/phosphodiesterase [Pseudorhodoferax sp.]|uniref:putative bifunctional diguanylate cyclase/phosphodiesterase n=1 Tax=Pseudorhodoferax sp. TaxID=1993553 RepID=UPI002DD651D9|nr:EAL domain-containing protein [Pseudorhodoferax sp.]
MPAALFDPTYDGLIVLMSIVVATFTSYVALDLARRVHNQQRWMALVWTFGGALVMGSGIWSMHFIGMLAMELPIEIGYVPLTTLHSWLAAVAVSALALAIATRDTLTRGSHVLGSLAMGAGICAMHYLGMAAIDLAPGIVWHWGWVAVSVVVACGASAVALGIFFGMRRLRGQQARLAQIGAAVVMGLAIGGVHYSGMAAAGFPAGAVCRSLDGLGGRHLGTVILVASVLMLTLGLFTSVLDARLQARASRLTRSLSQANAELERIAFLDGLTGVPNRTLFDDRLRQAVARVDRSRAEPGGGRPGAPALRLALLFIDLDGFKPINDSLGHAAGDMVLRQVAERLRTVVRDADTLARIGGDEFVLLIDDVGGPHDVAATAQRVLVALGRPFELPQRAVSLSASIGLVIYPDQVPADKLLASADAAMYTAKRAGGSTYAVFAPHMNEGSTDQLELLQDLREATARGQLRLHYQPKVDCQTGQVRSVEALLRWEHPRHGLLGPGGFIPQAERYGLIGTIGGWVIEEACRQIAAWADEGRRMRVSVNLSAYQLRQPDIAERVAAAIERHAISADQLVCEVTESAAMEDTRTTQRVLEELGALGVKLSIDDFGTGYSSLAKLRQMRAHELKIDREFVCDVATDADARAVVDAIVRLGHALGLRIVAEGVETAEQRDVLMALGCDELQGYLFARPLTPRRISELHEGDDSAAVQFSPSVLMEG